MFFVLKCPKCKTFLVREVRSQTSARFLCQKCSFKKKLFDKHGREQIKNYGIYETGQEAQKVCSKLKSSFADDLENDFSSANELNKK